jgi:hypothetical protein
MPPTVMPPLVFKFKAGDILWLGSDPDTGITNFNNCVVEVGDGNDREKAYLDPAFNAYRCYVHTGTRTGQKWWIYEKDLILLAT